MEGKVDGYIATEVLSIFVRRGCVWNSYLDKETPQNPKLWKFIFKTFPKRSCLMYYTLEDLKLKQIWKCEVVFYSENFTIQPCIPKVLKNDGCPDSYLTVSKKWWIASAIYTSGTKNAWKVMPGCFLLEENPSLSRLGHDVKGYCNTVFQWH